MNKTVQVFDGDGIDHSPDEMIGVTLKLFTEVHGQQLHSYKQMWQSDAEHLHEGGRLIQSGQLLNLLFEKNSVVRVHMRSDGKRFIVANPWISEYHTDHETHRPDSVEIICSGVDEVDIDGELPKISKSIRSDSI